MTGKLILGMMTITSFLVTGLLTTPSIGQAEAKKLSFRKHIYPILRRYCVRCHKPKKKKKGKVQPPAGGLDLSKKVAYKNIVDVQSKQAAEGYNIVTAGEVSRSYIMYKMLNQHRNKAFGPKVMKTDRMPPKKKLARWRIKRIIKWIKQGAKK